MSLFLNPFNCTVGTYDVVLYRFELFCMSLEISRLIKCPFSTRRECWSKINLQLGGYMCLWDFLSVPGLLIPQNKYSSYSNYNWNIILLDFTSEFRFGYAKFLQVCQI